MMFGTVKIKSSTRQMAWGSTARPLNWGFGRNAGPHLLGELFVLATGIDVNSVPYRSGADAVPDMLGRHVQVNFGTIESLSQLVREGQLRALVVTGETRSHSFPDVPTMTEAGFSHLTRDFGQGCWHRQVRPPISSTGSTLKSTLRWQRPILAPV